jgi:hypothetical protein
MATEKLRRHKSPGTDHILTELITATIYSEIHKLITSICNKEELSEQWKESMTVPVYKKSDKV